jgi:uncharacterized protein YacL (UPF0231 family)
MLNEAMDLIDSDVNSAIKKFNESILRAGSCMKKVVHVGKEKMNNWFDKECRDNKKTLKKLLKQFHRSNAVEDRIVYNNKRREYKELLRNKKSAYRAKTIQNIKDNMKNSTNFWGSIKKYIGKKTVANDIRVNDWYKYFQSLFNEEINSGADASESLHSENVEKEADKRGDNNVNNDTLECDISEQEVKIALHALKCNKAAGPDGIIGEFLKYSNDNELLIKFLVKFFNKLFSNGTYPDIWTESIIQPLHKKGDVNSTDNYRGISLLSITSKLYSHILNTRLNNWIEENEVIGENQAGFRRTYSTIDHVFTMYALIQRQLLYHKKLYAAFIDFRKAFDSVVREKLWNILSKNGIKNDNKMYKAIVSMYRVVKARVRVGGDLTEFFMCPRGVKQGEITSPVLFSLFIEELANEIRQRGRHGIQLMPDLIEVLILMFADDVILLSNTVCGLQTQLNILHETANKLGLVVNLEKSNIVVFRNGGHLAATERWKYGEHVMTVVNMYKYLGVFLSTRLSFSHAMNDAACRAKKGVVCILRLLWSLGEKLPDLFFKLFDCQIQPILNYGAEIWGLVANIKTIEQVHLFALKRFLNVSVRTPSDLVYGETGRYSLKVNICMKCVRFWLRILKMPPNRLPYKAYKMLLYLHEQNKLTWASNICFFLYEHGFRDVWDAQGAGDETLFLKSLKERLIDTFITNWTGNLQNKERFLFYSTFKSSFQISSILNDVKHILARNYLIRLRLGVSQLKTHKLRFAVNATYEDLVCPMCKGDVESEVHFLLVCPAYDSIRMQFIPKKYYNNPCLFKVTMLMASETKTIVLGLCNFVRHAFEYRRNILCTN